MVGGLCLPNECFYCGDASDRNSSSWRCQSVKLQTVACERLGRAFAGLFGDRNNERFPVVDDSDKPTDEPTNSPTEPVRSANASTPTADQWKEVGVTTLKLTQETLAGLWAGLRPIVATKASTDKPVSSETASLVDESQKPTKPTTEPFPTLDQWAETGKTIVGLTKRTADAVFSKPANNHNATGDKSRQVIVAVEDKPSESEAQPDVSFPASQTSATETKARSSVGKVYCPICRELTAHTTSNDFLTLSVVLTIFTCGLAFPLVILAATIPPLRTCKRCLRSKSARTPKMQEHIRLASVNLKPDELCVVNWSLSNEIRLPKAITTPGGSRVKCLHVSVNVYFRLSDGEPRVTRLTLGECNLAGLVTFTVAASRTGEAWTADASLKRYLEQSILPTITEDDVKQDDNLVRAMWSKYRSSLPDEHKATPWEAPTKKQLGFARKLGIDVSSSMSKEDVGLAIENGINENPTLKKELEERDEARRLERQRADELQRIEECGPELIAAEAQWEEFLDKIGFMLAIYQRGKKIIVDVLLVYEVFIDGKRKKKLKLGVASPTAHKVKVPGILWDETNVLLLWDREFVLALEKLLYYEPLRAKFDEADVWDYQRAIRRGLEVAKEKHFKVSPR